MSDKQHVRAAGLFPRPSEQTVSVERDAVADATCERCGSSHIERYPVLRVTGWKRLTRCQDCLAVSRLEEPPTPLGFTYLPYGSYLRSPMRDSH